MADLGTRGSARLGSALNKLERDEMTKPSTREA